MTCADLARCWLPLTATPVTYCDVSSYDWRKTTSWSTHSMLIHLTSRSAWMIPLLGEGRAA